jgi:hypothetical protein
VGFRLLLTPARVLTRLLAYYFTVFLSSGFILVSVIAPRFPTLSSSFHRQFPAICTLSVSSSDRRVLASVAGFVSRFHILDHVSAGYLQIGRVSTQ